MRVDNVQVAVEGEGHQVQGVGPAGLMQLRQQNGRRDLATRHERKALHLKDNGFNVFRVHQVGKHSQDLSDPSGRVFVTRSSNICRWVDE